MMPISRIINGKKYSTETAEMLVDISAVGYFRGDFNHEDTALFRTAKGTYFIAGEGGAESRWATTSGKNMTGGCGIELISEEEAKQHAAARLSVQRYEEIFGPAEEG